MTDDGVSAVDDDALPTPVVPARRLDGMDRRELTPHDVMTRLEDALSTAVRVLDVDRVGLMLLDENDDLQVVVSSDAVRDRLERAQQRLRIGPTWDSLYTGRPVAVDDLASTEDG